MRGIFKLLDNYMTSLQMADEIKKYIQNMADENNSLKRKNKELRKQLGQKS